MKSCQEVQELISCLIDGELDEAQQRDVERHIASCEECRSMAEAFRAVSQTIADDRESPDARLHETIMADVRREALRRRQAPKRARSLLALAACAALVILAAANLPRMGKAQAPMTAASGAAATAEESVLFDAAPAEAESVEAAEPAAEPPRSATSAPAASSQSETAGADAESSVRASKSERKPSAGGAASGCAQNQSATETESAAARAFVASSSASQSADGTAAS